MKDYRKKAAARDEEFKRDALEYAGLTGHPKADKAFKMAWDDSHSNGLAELIL